MFYVSLGQSVEKAVQTLFTKPSKFWRVQYNHEDRLKMLINS